MSQITRLPEQLQHLATQELGEMPSRIPADLEALKKWIQLQPHLVANTDNQFLIQFLRGCKFSLEKAKEKLDNFYSLRSQYYSLAPFYDLDTPIFRKFHNTG